MRCRPLLARATGHAANGGIRGRFRLASQGGKRAAAHGRARANAHCCDRADADGGTRAVAQAPDRADTLGRARVGAHRGADAPCRPTDGVRTRAGAKGGIDGDSARRGALPLNFGFTSAAGCARPGGRRPPPRHSRGDICRRPR